jgi:hypothetical protein
MALKDIWTNKTDGVDDILADDINAIANEVISNTEKKADRSELPTKVSQLENDTNYVTNTDYATADVGGVVKVGQYQKGLYIIPDTKQLSIYGAEKNDVETKTTSPRPILPYRVDYAVSKSTHQTMDDEYDTTTMYVNDASMVGAQGQLPASYNAVKGYVDDGLSTKADKADLDWKLIGEEEVTEADITAAGENGVTAVTIDLGAPIEQWYKETRIDIIIPASTDINSVNNGLFVCMGATEALSLNSDSGCVLMRSQGNSYAVLQYQYLNQIIFHTVWDKALPLYSLYVNSPYNGYAYAYNVYGTTTFKRKTKTAIGCQFISVSTKSNVGIFKFPAGTKISIYGRM